MSTDTVSISSIIGIAAILWHAVQHSALYFVISVFLKIYGTVLIIDIILLIFLNDIRSNLQMQRLGGRKPLIPKAKFLKRWDAIKIRTESGNPSHYKAAILEADALADEMLGEIGYEGGDIGERLELIMPGQLLSAERLQEAHNIRNRIIRESGFELPKEEAEELLAFYESFFKELELL
ncbi:MAG TPA: hypothetical protein VN420_03065 [Candidatus Fimivivens sp.]|nr:hypothetical protein [Candidatus Fimivivens sp.]